MMTAATLNVLNASKQHAFAVMNEIKKNFKNGVKLTFSRPLSYLEGDKVQVRHHKRNMVMLLKDNLFSSIKNIIRIEERYETIDGKKVYILEIPSIMYKGNYVLDSQGDAEYNEYGLAYVRTKAVQSFLELFDIYAWELAEYEADDLFYRLMRNRVPPAVYDALDTCHESAEAVFSASIA